MNRRRCWTKRPIACSIAFLLALPLAAQPQAFAGRRQDVTAESGDVSDLPAAPSPAGANAAAATRPQQSSEPVPVGTAAAPYEKPLGPGGARPAGAVIAPAKQRRAHSLALRVGLIVGAAVAVGTVVGLSKASPSHAN